MNRNGKKNANFSGHSNNSHAKVNLNELEDELLIRAFDADEDTPIPEDYVLDEINARSVEYLKTVDKERKLIELNAGTNSNSYMRDIEYSLNVDNSSLFLENYDKLGINYKWIEGIKREFKIMKNNLDNTNGEGFINSDKNNHSSNVKKMNCGEIINHYKLQKENLHNFQIPADDIKNELSAIMTNKICIKLITHFTKIFNYIEETNSQSQYIVMLWLYFLLLMLKTPLIDDDSSELYSLNKSIYKSLINWGEINTNTSNDDMIISLKIVHVILSEVFGQKVIY